MKKLRILIADDYEITRRGTRGLLKTQRAWRVVAEVGNGRDAVENARKLKPEIAIVDINMPELNGLEATRQIREAAPNTEVIVLTMHESDQMVRRVLEAGARGYVLKSDVAHQLIRAVKAVSNDKLFLTPKVSEIVLNGFLGAGNETRQAEQPQARPTPREAEIIRLLAEGKGNKEIAEALGITVRTVETHRANIMRKLNLHSSTELVRYAIRNNMVQP